MFVIILKCQVAWFMHNSIYSAGRLMRTVQVLVYTQSYSAGLCTMLVKKLHADIYKGYIKIAPSHHRIQSESLLSIFKQ